jgi:hypothetical protein
LLVAEGNTSGGPVKVQRGLTATVTEEAERMEMIEGIDMKNFVISI